MSYAYGAAGENLSLVDTPVNTGTTKKSFYGVNPHGDVETLTDATTGQTTSTYRYTAYGQADKAGTTGDDAIMDDQAKDADIVNPYRFSSGSLPRWRILWRLRWRVWILSIRL